MSAFVLPVNAVKKQQNQGSHPLRPIKEIPFFDERSTKIYLSSTENWRKCLKKSAENFSFCTLIFKRLKPLWKNKNKQLLCTILAGKQLFVIVFHGKNRNKQVFCTILAGKQLFVIVVIEKQK